MNAKLITLILGAGVLVTLAGVSRSNSNQPVGIDFNDSFQNRTTPPMTLTSSGSSSSSSSFSGGDTYFASATLSGNGTASLSHNRDTITLQILSADLQPMTYDGAGKVTLRVGYNGRKRTETLSLNPRFNPSSGGAYDSLQVGKYTLDLVSYSGNFDDPSFTFELH